MAAPNVTPSFFEAVRNMKRPNLNQFMAPKPTNIVSGAISCIGNTIGGAFIAVGVSNQHYLNLRCLCLCKEARKKQSALESLFTGESA